MTERKPTTTADAVTHAVGTVKAELAGLSGANTRRWMVDLTPDNGLLIRRLRHGRTQRIITASQGTPGSLVTDARITVLDLETGKILNEGPKPRRILRDAVRQIFPDRTAIHDDLNRTF